MRWLEELSFQFTAFPLVLHLTPTPLTLWIGIIALVVVAVRFFLTAEAFHRSSNKSQPQVRHTKLAV